MRALIVRKLLGREFQREIAEYMGERGIRLVFGFGRRIRLLVLGRREFDLSGFVGHQVWKKCVQWGGSRQWTKSKASMQRATLRREERVERPARERRRSCSMLPLDCSPRRSPVMRRAARRCSCSNLRLSVAESPLQASWAYSRIGLTAVKYTDRRASFDRRRRRR